MKIICCPKEKMIADYSTKHSQGSLFEFQRNTMLGVKKEYLEMCKVWCRIALEKYELWDAAEDDSCDT